MILFSIIAGYILMRAWEQAAAQAGAEYRRARAEWARAVNARLAAGEAAGPGDAWWWASAARKTWRGMRGPRRGAARARALPSSSPWRRIAAAAMAGARRGAADGLRRGRQHRQAARDTGRGWARYTAASAAAGWAFAWTAAGYAAGFASGRRRRARRIPVMTGACDDCGALCALAALEYRPVDVGGRTEMWLLCPACRPADVPPPPGPGDTPAAALTSAGPPGLAAALPDPGSEPEPEPEPAAAWPAPKDRLEALRASGWDGPVDEAGYAVMSRTSPDGRPLPLLEGSDGSGIVDELLAILRDELLELRDDPAPGIPPGAVSETEGEQMNTDLAVSGGRAPARAGESYSYGSWRRATLSDAALIDALGGCLEVMLSDLNAVNAGRTQVRNVTSWADRVAAEAEATRQALAEMDRRYRPVIAAVGAAGGPDEVSDLTYYKEI